MSNDNIKNFMYIFIDLKHNSCIMIARLYQNLSFKSNYLNIQSRVNLFTLLNYSTKFVSWSVHYIRTYKITHRKPH